MTSISSIDIAASCVRRYWRSSVAFVLALCAMSSAVAAPEAAELREAQFKAAYLFNFVKFVDWPANASAVLTVCFVGGDGVLDALSDGIDAKRRKLGPSCFSMHQSSNEPTSSGQHGSIITMSGMPPSAEIF